VYLLDTNICIYLIKGNPIVSNQLNKFSTNIVGISTISVAGLEFGIHKSALKKKNRKALEKFLRPFEIFSFSESAAFHYGIIRANLEKKGKIIGANGMLIAAQALELNRTLVTNNEKEFNRIPNLKIENWTK